VQNKKPKYKQHFGRSYTSKLTNQKVVVIAIMETQLEEHLNPDLFAKYLDFNSQLLRNFKTILVTLSCCFLINVSQTLENFVFRLLNCKNVQMLSLVSNINDTAQNFNVWYDSEIVRYCVLPVEMLAEETI